MDSATSFGWLSILPPIIAIVLALITKEVISSLIVGIMSGALIYSGGNIIDGVSSAFGIMAERAGGNINIILFLALLGALVAVIAMAGGSRAYGMWAATKIKSKVGAQLATAALGVLIFIDDYFNCLTVGTVMKPVTDKYSLSRPKLAYLIDSTAAPVCIIAPISSWAVAVGGFIQEGGIEDGMGAFIATIPYNLYAILTLLMVVILSVRNLDFGSMAKVEAKAAKGDLSVEDVTTSANEIHGKPISSKGKVIDLIIPISALIILSVLAMLYIGGYGTVNEATGQMYTIAEAFGDTDASAALVLSGFGALVVAFMLFIPRKVLSFRSFMSGITSGIISMVPAFIILTLAWTISGVCQDLLQTGTFVGEAVRSSNVSIAILPAIIFLVAAFLSFAMGTSWGTFGILIPIVIIICGESSVYLIPALGATLAGSVYGDHCSPISDTTILASTGAGCHHIDHVSTQIPYATVTAICCFVGYVICGIAPNPVLPLAVSAVLLVASLFVLHKFKGAKA